MRANRLEIEDFRHLGGCSVVLGKRLTAVAGNNGTGKSTILGLLANSSQLPHFKTMLGGSYKAQFSELFKATPEHDPKGQHIVLHYLEHGESKVVRFRTAWQAGGTRFRIIPKRVKPDGSVTEAKLESPVIYLGLSRLYPVGEAPAEVVEKGPQWASDEDREWFETEYSRILSIHDPIRSVRGLSLKDLTRKHGTGIETACYSAVSNSAGQDNLGQILLSVLSFKNLKAEMGDRWDGGLLIIDEVDATLHPAAQLRLVNLLDKESKSTGFQVVFTTHSTTVLQELCQKCQHNNADEPGNIEIAYLSNANGNLSVKRNPSWLSIENDLLVSNVALHGKPVGVFTEDAEARWLLRELLKARRGDLLSRIDLLEISIGCDALLDLYAHDYSYMGNRVVVLDGDVADEKVASAVPRGVPRAESTVLKLPGARRPENVLWEYLNEPAKDHPGLWDALDSVGITQRSVVENPPDVLFADEQRERVRFKKWFKKYEQYFSDVGIVGYWANDHAQEVEAFAESFVRAFNVAARRVLVPEASLTVPGAS